MPGLATIAGRAMMDTRPWEDLEYLSDHIGGRVTGSEPAREAIAWAAGRMSAAGLKNVHTEPFPVKRGWTRGSASAEIVSPAHRRLSVTSFGWAASTPAGGIEADVVRVELGREYDPIRDDSGRWSGKVLFARVGAGKPVRAFMLQILANAAENAGAAAIVLPPFRGAAAGMQLAHTSALRGVSAVPIVATTAEGDSAIGRLLERGEKVRLRLDVQNVLTAGPVESANVVGEIPGTDRAGEILLVGAHLDSWDLGDGATDDGFGVACVLGAARAISASGFRPRRTIRFALFTGEEQGFLGSLAYTRAHRREMPDFVAALVLDSGQGPITALDLGGRRDLVPAVEEFAAAVRAFGSIRVSERTEFGTDTLPFTLEGIPGINLDQDSPDYERTHHSAADTFDKVREDYLLRDATVLALAAYWIAARPERLATPWPPASTARMLIGLGEDQQLKLLGLWPFDAPNSAPQ